MQQTLRFQFFVDEFRSAEKPIVRCCFFFCHWPTSYRRYEKIHEDWAFRLFLLLNVSLALARLLCSIVMPANNGSVSSFFPFCFSVELFNWSAFHRSNMPRSIRMPYRLDGVARHIFCFFSTCHRVFLSTTARMPRCARAHCLHSRWYLKLDLINKDPPNFSSNSDVKLKLISSANTRPSAAKNSNRNEEN